ncbi:MAG TPA: hypothetical protein VL240_05250 [Candidatus Binatia bacterium]|nr:hypothetical protein [Candidatus Binatia bacterium]
MLTYLPMRSKAEPPDSIGKAAAAVKQKPPDIMNFPRLSNRPAFAGNREICGQAGRTLLRLRISRVRPADIRERMHNRAMSKAFIFGAAVASPDAGDH